MNSEFNLFHQSNSLRNCGIAGIEGKSFVDVYLIFTLKLRATHLLRSPYSDYQQFLYNTITDFLDKGWNYKQIADWLNDNGYKTPRRKRFRNNHVHSIVKKKRIRDFRLSRSYETKLTDFSLRFIDKTKINTN